MYYHSSVFQSDIEHIDTTIFDIQHSVQNGTNESGTYLEGKCDNSAQTFLARIAINNGISERERFSILDAFPCCDSLSLAHSSSASMTNP